MVIGYIQAKPHDQTQATEEEQIVKEWGEKVKAG